MLGKSETEPLRHSGGFLIWPELGVLPVWRTEEPSATRRAAACLVNPIGARHPPPPFCVSIDSTEFSSFHKFIRINTCGQFSEVLILKNLWSDKTRQNTVKHGVLVDGENIGVAKFEVAENKKRQLEAGATK